MKEKFLNYHMQITDLQYTLNLLSWDLRVSCPEGAYNDLINLINMYENKLFILKTSDEYGKLLNDLINSEEFLIMPEEEKRYIQRFYKEYLEDKKVPSDFYSEYSLLKNKANIAWMEAREKNDYNVYVPLLKQIIEYTKKYYTYISPDAKNLYDVMLDRYETGMTSSIIDPLFLKLKEVVIKLLKKHAKQNSTLKVQYTKDELMDIAKFLLNYQGFDLNRGELGIYPHGYTEKMGPNDVRIAFEHATDPASFVGTIIHEGGHGIFEQNIDKNISKYENTCIGVLFALHESQSRFYENILGRNVNFWIPIYEKIKPLLKLDISVSEFVSYLNSVSYNPIRINADELSYCLHIILRYEIERDLFNGKISVEDLPKVWNQKMKEYLNIDVLDEKYGLMQDVHWSQGDFGYFPSYLLGTIYDGMFKDVIEEKLGSIDELLKSGRIKEITKFLNDNIHKFGGAYNSLEVIKKVTNKELSVDPIIKYFEDKFN